MGELRRMCGLMVVAAVLSGGLARGQATAPSAGDVIYDDAAATSSATVTQVLPDGKTQATTMGAVRRISLKGDTFIIEWAGTATTVIPKQYVLNMTLNKRAAATEPGR